MREMRPETSEDCWFQCRCKRCDMVLCAATFEDNHKGPSAIRTHTFLNECSITIPEKRCHYGFE
jgi:hypothetical protein